ncbi:N-terminal kinase-like protein [Styela clava]
MWSIFSRDPTKDFAFEVGEKISGLDDQSIWTLHKGTRKANGESVSIFAFDVAESNDAVRQVASSSIKRLKTLRHPNVLTFIDSLEAPKCIYIVTEPVVPLLQHLKTMETKNATRDLAISWGLHQISKGLSFLVNTVNLIHNNVCMSSIFVDQSGEWKLGGVDYMYPASGEGSNLPPFKTLPMLEKYDPPEKSARNRNKKSSKWSSDMWGLGCLIWEVFNGPLPRTSSLKVVGKIPKSLVAHYCELVGANPASRPSPDRFIENCRTQQCFMNNYFVDTNLFLEEIQIKDQGEKNEFFNQLPDHLDEFPIDYSKHKILPQLLNAFQFGNAGPAVLPPLFKLGALLEADEYQQRIVPCVVKLFSSTDRATRIHLLRQLPLFIEHLKPQVVNSQIFPNIITGFMDTNPAIREQSIKAMLLLAPKLNDNNLNNELMKHFARLQSRDDQGPIRTNTTVCLGKIACHLNASTRQKVVSSAFGRAMRDPFPAARIAGVLAMAGNVEYFNTKDCAYKALPALCSLTVDPDKNVRVNSFKTISVFLQRLEKASEDPEFAAKIDADASAASTGTAASVVAGVSGWTGWMSTGVTSLTSRLYKKGGEPQDAAPETDQSAENTSGQQKPPGREEIVNNKNESKQEDDDASDYGEEDNNDEDNGWKDDNDGWDDLEVKVDEEKSDGEQQIAADDDADWNDSGWDVDDFDDNPAKKITSVSKSSSKTSNKSKSSMVTGKKSISSSSGWDDWGSNDDNMDSSEWNDDSTSTQEKTDIKPASLYNWSNDQNVDPNSDDFFSDIVAKPAKSSSRLGQQAKQTIQSSSSFTKVHKKQEKRKEENSIPSVDNSSNDWGWGNEWNNENQGLSKAELMKKQREEKRRQRQEEMEKKRAARAGGGKLSARKMD